MAFSPSFLATQVIGLPQNIVLSDNSTGSDIAISSRRVYLTNASNSFVVPSGDNNNYIDWALITNPLTIIGVLPSDMSFYVLVQWLDVSNNVLYSVTQLNAFTLNTESFYYGLTQNQTSTPNIVNDTNYYNNKMILRCSIDEANNAVIFNDIYSSQSALDRATALINDPNAF